MNDVSTDMHNFVEYTFYVPSYMVTLLVIGVLMALAVLLWVSAPEPQPSPLPSPLPEMGAVERIDSQSNNVKVTASSGTNSTLTIVRSNNVNLDVSQYHGLITITDSSYISVNSADPFCMGFSPDECTEVGDSEPEPEPEPEPDQSNLPTTFTRTHTIWPEYTEYSDSDAEDADAEDSDAEDSDAEDSDAEDSDAEDSDAEDSDAEDSDSDAENSDAEDLDVEDSDAEDSDMEDSDAEDKLDPESNNSDDDVSVITIATTTSTRIITLKPVNEFSDYVRHRQATNALKSATSSVATTNKK